MSQFEYYISLFVIQNHLVLEYLDWVLIQEVLECLIKSQDIEVDFMTALPNRCSTGEIWQTWVLLAMSSIVAKFNTWPKLCQLI